MWLTNQSPIPTRYQSRLYSMALIPSRIYCHIHSRCGVGFGIASQLQTDSYLITAIAPCTHSRYSYYSESFSGCYRFPAFCACYWPSCPGSHSVPPDCFPSPVLMTLTNRCERHFHQVLGILVSMTSANARPSIHSRFIFCYSITAL